MFLDRGENPQGLREINKHHTERLEPNKNLADCAKTTTGATPRLIIEEVTKEREKEAGRKAENWTCCPGGCDERWWGGDVYNRHNEGVIVSDSSACW